MTLTADPETLAALGAARDAYARSVPTSALSLIGETAAIAGWLGENADRIGADRLNDLAARLRGAGRIDSDEKERP